MFGLGHEAKQNQSQTVSAATVFEARLLQAAGLELDALVAAALSENPFLTLNDEVVREDGESDMTTDDEAAAFDALDAPEADLQPDWGVIDVSLTGGADAAASAIESAPSPDGGGVRAHLESQLSLARLTPPEMVIARRLIADLDDVGYLTTSTAEIAASLGVTKAAVADVLYVLRGFEPSGAFAGDLAECLAFQAADAGVLNPAMKAVLFRLDLIAEGRIKDVAARAGLALADIEASVAHLRRFDPRPGLRFGAPAEPPGPPEMLVSRDPELGWRARLNPDAFPDIAVDQKSRDTFLAAVRRPEEKRYVKDRWRDARFFKDALARRAATLQRVGAFLVERQSAFFDHGAAALVPLRQSDAAEALALDPSTVSRALSGKRLRCPRGLFDLTAFFPGAVSDETDSAPDSVKARIRTLIDTEDSGAPLSDDALAERLKLEGMGVARRTVAKYRESLGLAPARRRRRLKA